MKRLLTALAALGMLTACTPEQIAKITTDPQVAAVLAPLDDAPLQLADRSVLELDGTITPAPPLPDAVTLCNSLTYGVGLAEPALQCFRAVAGYRGWTERQIDSWMIAAKDIMKGESGFCPNVLGGARWTGYCEIIRQGRKSDAGFGQLISIHYRPGRWLCKEEGLCSKWDIIASPFNSMTAMVAMIEKSGVQPWCFANWARRYHRAACNNPGIDVP